MPELKGKVAIITGASSGIGESTAKHFASLGCWLTLVARTASNLEKVAEACRSLGLPRDKVLVVPGDVTVYADCENVVQKTVNHFGKIDILVNNAGAPGSGSLETASVEDFNKAWRINVGGPLCLTKNAMPYLRETKGSIVNVSTISAFLPTQFNLPYCITKAAMQHLMRCAALENAPYGVRINTVSPGPVKTLIAKPPGVDPEEFLKMFEKEAGACGPTGRIATPEEVAQCIAFLASDGASFVTGITMPVDGGVMLMSTVASAAMSMKDIEKTA